MVAYLTAGVKADPYSGQPIGEDWSNPTRTEAPAAFVLSASTDASSDGTNRTVSTVWTLFVPEGEKSPEPGDRIDFDGQLFVMDGVPIRERNPFTGWAPYAQVRLERSGASNG